MSDIFISYAKEDRERARALAEALEQLGWSVWWDRIIPTGQVFADVIKEEIDTAGCVVVLWSGNSVSSEWVRREAREAAEQKKLFPGLIERVDPPWEFGEVHACDLVDWDGEAENGDFPLLVGDLGRILGTPPKQVEEGAERRTDDQAKPPPGGASVAERQRTIAPKPADDAGFAGLPRWLVLVAVATLMAVLLWWGLFKWSPWVRGDLAGAKEAEPSGTVETEPEAAPEAPERAATIENELSPLDEAMGPADQRRGQGSPTWDEDAAHNRRILIEGGTFQVGSAEGRSNERPQHRVTVSDFYIQRHEVMNREYRRFDPDHEPEAPDDHPAASVPWEQARAYAQWLGGDLPTEAQWEFAARSRGEPWSYPWGDQPADCTRAVMADGGAGGSGCGRNSTWPVCSKTEGNTEQDVCDMAGNVWEWCLDWYNPHEYARRAQGAVENPPGPGTGSARVLRGGSFLSASRYVRGADRDRDRPEIPGHSRGFRVAWSAAGGLD